MTKNTKKVGSAVSVDVAQDIAKQLAESFPQETGGLSINLPRLGMYSQDKTEGKGKAMKVVAEAGIFYTENKTDEVDEDGKNIWEKKEIGTEFEGIVVFRRKQLRMYDEATEEYTSSPVYDDETDVIPLFLNKKEVDRGTPADLKKKFEYVTKDGKTRSKLEENYVLYVLKDETLYQLNLRGSSMWSFRDYARKGTPNLLKTKFSSTAEANGSISWNKMSFTPLESLQGDELQIVLDETNKIKTAIAASKASFNGATIKPSLPSKADKDFDNIAADFGNN